VTITEFLAARLGEDDAGANEVHRPRDCGCVDHDGEFSSDPMYCSCDGPARALREVEAIRAILGLYEEAEPVRCTDWDSGYSAGEMAVLKAVIAALAVVYSGHPDYDPAWVPP